MSSRSLPKSVADKLRVAILGEKYELSLVFSSNALSRKLNRIYRGKDKSTNVLAFPLSKTSGEIFINKSHLDGFSVPELFIHGLLHLKGHEHGAKMESEEKRFLKLFNGQITKSRNRHRNSNGKGRHRRRSS